MIRTFLIILVVIISLGNNFLLLHLSFIDFIKNYQNPGVVKMKL